MASLLIVDDDPDNVALLTMMLKRGGHVMVSAAGGGRALEIVRTIRPDVILLDATLPDIDGYETCRRLRAEPGLRGVPILFLSAHADPRSMKQALEAGGTAYLTKPIGPNELLEEVRKALGNR